MKSQEATVPIKEKWASTSNCSIQNVS